MDGRKILRKGKRITWRTGIVLVGIAAIVYWFLTQVGVVLAISPALEWITGVLAFLSDPLVLAAVLVVVGTAAVVVWQRVDDVGAATVELFARLKERLGFDSPVDVRGSLEHEDVRWIAHHTRDGVTTIEHRACPNCAVELEQETIPYTDLNRPNTPITADETTQQREEQAWENVFGREKSGSEELTEALVCPRETCRFSIPGEKHIKSGETAVKKQFRMHFRRMRDGSNDPISKWHHRAAERLDSDLEPTPADVWDAYARECDDESVPLNQSFGQGLPGKDTTMTCHALKLHKNNAAGVDQLIELTPADFDKILAWLVRSEYLETRREITRKMNEEIEQCQSTLTTLEHERGSVVQQVLGHRYNRTEPHIDLENAEHELDGANESVRELREDLDLDYLPADHQRWLSACENGVVDAVEYVVQLRAFGEYRGEIEPTIEKFEERFEPYKEGENYMTTPDQKFLEQRCSTICQLLSDLHREVQLELLPQEMTEWAGTQKARFTERSRRLPTYNKEFVAHEREQYADLFETEHGPLNEEQQKAVVRNDRHNLVDASAGTGKTLTLTYRFLYLYKRGVPLDDIVAVTFTGDAADEMESRIAEALEGVEPHQLNISTYHSFAGKIVADSVSGPVNTDLDGAHEQFVERILSGDNKLKDRHPEAMSEFEKYHSDFLRDEEDYIDRQKDTDQSRHEFLCEQYSEFLETARNFDQTPDEIRSRLSRIKLLQHHFGKAACEILRAFLDHAEGTDEPVDFHDMVKGATRLGGEAPEHFSQEYQHILFDEFQDADGSVLEFVSMFLGGSGDTRLFAVGDDWQSIYGFKGSDPRYFIEFEEQFEGVKHTQLAVNYRCPPTIVEAGEELMANSEDDQNEKDVRAFSDARVTPEVHKLSGVYENRAAVYATNLIENALSDEDMTPEDVMVLSRNDGASPFMNRIRSQLDEREIPRIPVDEDDEIGVSDGVQVQSIHKSKGTEAECVILVNATDDEHHGLPQQKRENELITPASANPATHYAEERRLFYVAMTRAEHKLHVVTRPGHESRYLKEIDGYFEEQRSDVWTATGTLGPWKVPDTNSDMPLKAQLTCNGYTVNLKAWDTTYLRTLESGGQYHLSNIDPQNDGWGAQIKLNESVEVERLDRSDPQPADS